MWINPDNCQNTAPIISQRYYISSNYQGRGINVLGNGQLTFWTRNSSAIWTQIYTPCTASEWTHVALTQDGNYLKAYINGELANSTNIISNLGTSYLPYFTLGRYTDTTANYYNGSIDDVQIYSRALAEEEIGALYNATAYKYSRNITGLPNGAYTAYAYAVTSSGTISNSSSTFSVNTTNYAPNITAPTLSAPEVHADDIITCINGTYTDLDDSTVTWNYTWFINGTETASGSSLDLASEGAQEGDEITCMAVAYDGIDHSEGMNCTAAVLAENGEEAEGETIIVPSPEADWLTLAAIGMLGMAAAIFTRKN
jgi:hypothetical protein